MSDITKVPQTLLLADDSVTIQRVIELTFADEDIKVVAVSDGNQAIAQLDANPPDIVLADVGMPGKNGYEVAAYVKKTPHLAHIPVLLLTGAFEPVDQVKASAAGCDGVLAKPFEPQLVIGRVRELLGRPAKVAAATADPSLAPPKSVADFLPAPPVEKAPSREPVVASSPRIDDYFDRLDAAFASFSQGPASEPLASAPSATVPVPDELDWFKDIPQAEDEPEPDVPLVFELPPPPARVPEDRPEDRPKASPKALPEDPLEAAFAAAALAEVELVEPEPEPPAPLALVARLEPPAPPEPREPLAPLEPLAPPEPLEPSIVVDLPSTGRVLPSIADAFAAILSAEQNALGVKPEWPTPSTVPVPPAAPAPVVITDDVVDRVARRVIEQLSDRVVRETVASIASDTAERLVKEEIERIKASIK